MNLNNRLLWHFLETKCEYICATNVDNGTGKLYPAAMVWEHKIIPMPGRYMSNDRPGYFVCIIAIKPHSVMARIVYNGKGVLDKTWWRWRFNVFKLIQWVEDSEGAAVKGAIEWENSGIALSEG